jgi:DNA-binding MarR family transcriptional regulator
MLFGEMQQELQTLTERYVAPYGLSVMAWHALSKIEVLGDGATLTAIGERIMASPSTMTGIAARLERAGLVVRAVSPRDQRASILSLTDEGRRIQRAIFSRYFSDLSEAVECVDVHLLDDVLRAFQAILAGLHTLLEREPDEASRAEPSNE